MSPSLHNPIQSDAAIGQVIRERRKAIGMSQDTLSSLSGIAQPNLSKIERGKAGAKLDTYLKLCALIGIDLFAVPRS
ncbi:helix-turn-helix domain-containing protein [Asticcacaulis sp. AC402]|uniref:helix-turn-helix domain-containing protein n=1 Tax=Asticcacaulis sp. AC402 TaxID=1282361 RepID=UPI0003C3ED21|nr:helix-turn-helix transcriptional regulator [Asticcacaulis sp. AC402]ESQ75031.1 hypothetical protein ABAC402_11545 [Asticcacaulis sp. AC402]